MKQLSVSEEPIAQEFEPKIIAFLCNWCSYAAADLAGTSRIQYPPNIRVIRVMCSGSVDPLYILKPILEGADGVLIAGCHPGDCHYLNGNYKARRRVAMAKTILKQFGIAGDRVWFCFVSASEGRVFADTVRRMVTRLKELGPNSMKAQWEI